MIAFMIRGALCILLLSYATTITSAQSGTQSYLAYQIGAWGDDSSIGSVGFQAAILTNAYGIPSTTPRLDYFWVGVTLANGALVQFGYSLETGYYCLSGTVTNGRARCAGDSEIIRDLDARWEWQYWPDVLQNNYRYGIGPSASAGPNGTWHTYSIVAKPNGWNFSFDGQLVHFLEDPIVPSRNAVHVVAEQITLSSLSRLGPVEFRDLSYLKDNTWRSVRSLSALSGCAFNSSCTVENPYGVSLVGMNHIIAGSGIERKQNGQLLWSEGSTTSASVQRSALVSVLIGIVVVAGAAFSLIGYMFRKGKGKRSKRSIK